MTCKSHCDTKNEQSKDQLCSTLCLPPPQSLSPHPNMAVSLSNRSSHVFVLPDQIFLLILEAHLPGGAKGVPFGGYIGAVLLLIERYRRIFNMSLQPSANSRPYSHARAGIRSGSSSLAGPSVRPSQSCRFREEIAFIWVEGSYNDPHDLAHIFQCRDFSFVLMYGRVSKQVSLR